MALLDLSFVTQALKKLLQDYFKNSPAWTNNQPPQVSPQPPHKINGDGLSLYLYHLAEDPQFKNLTPPGKDVPPVRFTPMGLNLYYLLTAHGGIDNDDGALKEQLMMGIAIKALHDYPMINDQTEVIEDEPVFPSTLRGSDNHLRIVFQPTPPNEATNYWTAGDIPLQLATYYQVSVVFLEPENVSTRAGRVYVRGIHTFIDGTPRLASSQNHLSIPIPGETEPHEIELRPAQVPVGNQVRFFGSGLTGDSTLLLLKSSRWEEPVSTDPSWGVTVASDNLVAEVQEKASSEDVIPGIYSALVKVTKKRTLSDGTIRDFEHLSNECPFTITPRIDDIIAGLDDVITVKGYIFKHPGLPASALEIYIGETRLAKKTSASLNPGEYELLPSPSPDVSTELKLRLPQGLTSGRAVPLRVLVNGAESPPNWITIS